MPFLTLEDPNAKIKGSRDPLGQMTLWASFGRHVVTNLTTQSTTVRGYTTLLLGRYFCEVLLDEGVIAREDILDVCLRMEQLSAYARHVGHDVEGEIRGIERVKAFLAEGKGKVTIQSDRTGMILSDQKVYGLWGLYSVPSRVSGFIPEGPLGVAAETRKFIEQTYLPDLERQLRPIKQLLAKGGRINTHGKDQYSKAFQALVNILPPGFTPEEEHFYGAYLRDALHVADRPHVAGHVPATGQAPTASQPNSTNQPHAATQPHGRQQRFRQLLEAHTDLNAIVDREEILLLAQEARRVDEGLATDLNRITQLEALLAPADKLFSFVLSQENQHLSDAAAKLADAWGTSVPNINLPGFRDLLPEIKQLVGSPIAASMSHCAEALSLGDYREAIRQTLTWNRLVMEGRKAGPWALLGKNGKIEVRYRELDRHLPTGDELPTLWRNSYFIDALKSVTLQLKESA